jgi:hypothetical protein
MQTSFFPRVYCLPLVFSSQFRKSFQSETARRLTTTGLVLFLLAAPAGAQPGSLSGKVTASVGDRPLPKAEVKLVGTGLTAVAAERGEFQFDSVPSGKQVVEVNLPGYSPKRLDLRISAGESVYLHIELASAAPVVLTPVEVKAEAEAPLTPAMQGFEARRARGVGTFFTRDEIARMQVRLFTDVLRRVPGMSVQAVNGAYGGGYSIQAGRAQGLFGPRTCPILYYMNGSPFPINADVAINNYVGPDDVLAVEVYTGSSQVPPQFSSSATNSLCGVVLIWTRSGSDRQR